MGWPHREVQPDGAMLIALNQQFVKVLVRFVADVEQDSRIAYQLFHILYAYIHGTARQMIAIGNPTYRPIQLRRSVAAVDDYRNSCSFAQCFQPFAEVSEICNRLMTGDVIHFGMTTASGELPERKVLGEFCITIQLNYLFHFSLLMLIF